MSKYLPIFIRVAHYYCPQKFLRKKKRLLESTDRYSCVKNTAWGLIKPNPVTIFKLIWSILTSKAWIIGASQSLNMACHALLTALFIQRRKFSGHTTVYTFNPEKRFSFKRLYTELGKSLFVLVVISTTSLKPGFKT